MLTSIFIYYFVYQYNQGCLWYGAVKFSQNYNYTTHYFCGLVCGVVWCGVVWCGLESSQNHNCTVFHFCGYIYGVAYKMWFEQFKVGIFFKFWFFYLFNQKQFFHLFWAKF